MKKDFNSPIPSPTEELLRQLGRPYEIRQDGVFVIPGSLDLSGLSLTRLPDLSSVVVEGNFSCKGNRLTSLKGAPKSVGGDFLCDMNPLVSLEHAPAAVGGDFSCSFSGLKTLEGAPRQVGGNFECEHNDLRSLRHAPETVGGDFFCWNNQLASLEGAPRAVGGNFLCYFNRLATLEQGPETVGGLFACFGNELKSLDGAPRIFKGIKSDFGTFPSWQEIPEALAPRARAWFDGEMAEIAAAKARLRSHPRPKIKKPAL